MVLAATAGAAVAALAVTLPGAFAAKAPAKPGAAKQAWNVLQPGKKVYGVVGGGCSVSAVSSSRPADSFDCATTGSIFPFSKVPITPEKFGVFGGAVENPECAGDIQDPTPTPGVVCIYLNPDEAVNVKKNGEDSLEVEAAPVYGGGYGFKLRWKAAAAGFSEVYGVWVYQAP